ncbi:hypothetical protein RJ641_031346 [Dillenia turbinata]|uniref:Transmembrane protein n=1 Tax=Dillenia turbinata TaxID=194707 RepID=A0AAN8VMK5_9MAGN
MGSWGKMAELFGSSTAKTRLSSLLLSDFMFFCSFILSHPLYFSYIIFFSPYLLKLLSFLSPLFITTTLLLLSLLTIFPTFFHDTSSQSDSGFFITTYSTFVHAIRSKIENNVEDFDLFEDSEVYKVVFDTSIVHKVGEDPEEIPESEVKFIDLASVCESSVCNVVEEKGEAGVTKMEVRPSERRKLQESENSRTKVEEKVVEELVVTKSKKVEGLSSMNVGSKAMENEKINGTHERLRGVSESNFERFENGEMGNFKRLGSYRRSVSDSVESCESFASSLGRYGSMRRETEWKNTLACKLYEERNNVEGSEGMDLLWERYEMDSSKLNNAKSKGRKSKKSGVEYNKDEEDDDNDEEEGANGQLCCLQALKFSTRKMNIGMGRPNLMKISKALKGFGLLHHVKKHGKKG